MKENVSHTSGLVKLSELKGPLLPVRSLPVADSVMSQRGGGACEEEQEEEEEEAAAVVRRRSRKLVAAEGGEVKIRSRRQKDFDPTAVEEEEAEPQESREKADPAVWTQNQQKLLELALQQFPRGTPERWDRIAKVVPGKTKEECMIRYKMLAELVQKRKQAKN
ncbi:dnaJ homolog subfamily C member 1 [Morone saxatilis]|uniref:dnaJ homolog subfamily C member 1 n=1 Tax=Morone saxatilis TaxID=34816 RepID=UPI0015E1E410|nr:dnaJ homolog subfamily C member 1 [Morone saxatilis]